METARTGFFDVSPTKISASLAVLALIGTISWNYFGTSVSPIIVKTPSTISTATDTDDLAALSLNVSASTGTSTVTRLGAAILAQTIMAYDNATKDGSPSDKGIAAVQSLAATINPQIKSRTYAASDIKTDPDTSAARVLSYRADLRIALEPLLENKEYELDIFARYVESKDTKNLSALRAAVKNYRLAIANTEKVVAPADAASYQASILSALDKFATTLEALADNATDPFASAALLKSYVGAQDGMVVSFNAIGKYAARKIL